MFTGGLEVEESIVEESRARTDSTSGQKWRFALPEFLGLLWSTSTSAIVSSSIVYSSSTSSSTALVVRAGHLFEPRTQFVDLFDY